MPDEKTLGNETGGENTPPSGNGQPENKASESTEEITTEVDSVLGEQGSKDPKEIVTDKFEDLDEESVIVPKTVLKDIQKRLGDGENYRKGLLSVKGKLKASKKQAPPAKPKTEEKKETETLPTGTDRFFKSIQKTAINKACEDAEINDNWNEIIKHYNPKRGKDTVQDIVSDINDAHTLWGKGNKDKKDKDEKKGDKKSTSQLASESGSSGGSQPTGSGTGDKPESIIPKKVSVKDWFPKKEAD